MGELEISNHMRLKNKANHDSIVRRKLVYRVGVNDADYIVTTYLNGKRKMCPAYRSWADMLARGYSDKLKNKHPTYIGVSVCVEWHSFMKFRSWWELNQKDGWHLDKDLVNFKNCIYSPENCVYVPQHLNKLITDHGLARGDYKIGVRFDNKSKKFHARCWSQVTGKRESLGLFNTEDEAHQAWVDSKIKTAAHLKVEMDSIHLSIYENVCRIIRGSL